jgi:hypothetical protein
MVSTSKPKVSKAKKSPLFQAIKQRFNLDNISKVVNTTQQIIELKTNYTTVKIE